MAGVNKVIIIGRLGADPELGYFPSGDAYCNLSVATSERWKDKTSGEQKESTEWHRVTLKGRLAENAAQYLKKGSNAYFEGKLKTRKWTDGQGIERYSTEIHVNEMQFLDSAQKDGPAAASPAPQQRSQRPAGAPPPPKTPDYGDDIPF